MKPSVIALTLFCKTSTYRRSNGPCSQRRTTDDGQATSCCPRLRWSSDLKSHLRLIHGSMILDNIRTRFLGGNLYAGATYTRVYTVFYTNCIGYQYARELLSRRPCWYTNVNMAWLRHPCRHTVSQRHHTAVVSPALCWVRSTHCSTYEDKLRRPQFCRSRASRVEQSSSQSPSAEHFTASVQKGNDWKCSCSRITVIMQRLTWRICCVAKYAPYKCH